MKFGDIFHLGIVVENLDSAVEIYEKELGYGPFEMGDGSFFAKIDKDTVIGTYLKTPK